MTELKAVEQKNTINNYYENMLSDKQVELKELFDKKQNKLMFWVKPTPIDWSKDNETIANQLLKNYSFSEIQEIIKNNKKALPLMYIMFDKAELKDLNNTVFRDNVASFFDIDNREYEGLLKNQHFNKLLEDNYQLTKKKITNKELEEFITLLYQNGYYKGLYLVKDLFNTAFTEYTNTVEKQRNEINRLRDRIKSSIETKFSSEELKNVREEILASIDDSVTSKSISKSISNIFEKNGRNDYNAMKKNADSVADEVAGYQKEINKCKDIKKEARDSFKTKEKYFFDYFDRIVRKQVFYEDFPSDDIEKTFIDICVNLWNFLNTSVDDKDEKEVYELIKDNLDSIIPGLLEQYAAKYRDSAKNYYSQYCRLDSLYQRLYKFTSREETKIRILTTYSKDDSAPIPFEIIKEALDMKKFSTLDSDARVSIILCIKQRYEKLAACDGIDYENESILSRLNQINRDAICNTDLPCDVRNKAFKWYFDFEKNEEKKLIFCWELIEKIDEIELDKLEPVENDIYSECRRYLILNETDDKLKNKLTAFMNSAKSKGIISDFVYGFAQYGGNDASFGMLVGRYGEQKKTSDRMIRWFKNEWDERLSQ